MGWEWEEMLRSETMVAGHHQLEPSEVKDLAMEGLQIRLLAEDSHMVDMVRQIKTEYRNLNNWHVSNSHIVY